MNVIFTVCDSNRRAEEFDKFLKELGWKNRTINPYGIEHEISAGSAMSTRSEKPEQGARILEIPLSGDLFDWVMKVHRRGGGRNNQRISYFPSYDSLNRSMVHFYGERKRLILDLPNVVREMPKHRLDGDAYDNLKSILQHYGESV